jgi:hypothetical protein
MDAFSFAAQDRFIDRVDDLARLEGLVVGRGDKRPGALSRLASTSPGPVYRPA